MLTALPGIAFGVAVDRNGYVATHHLHCSKPQGADPVWNAANCRNRRFFNNAGELSAARNTSPYYLRSYVRDMGGGRMVILKDASAPIFVRGRHWGGFRLGYDI